MDYRQQSRHRPTQLQSPQKRARRWPIILPILVVIAAAAFVAMHGSNGTKADQTTNQRTNQTSKVTNPSVSQAGKAATNQTATTKPAATACDKNTAGGQLVLVSISQRHLWACDGTSQLYDSAVVTGMENLAADLTPTGTYHVYGKYVNTYLKGSDSTGSWNDYVHYWMPWLHNKYGSYGFHDATWRADSDFGNISPYSSNASHGCVELPLATAKWLYGWAVIGTTVTVES